MRIRDAITKPVLLATASALTLTAVATIAVVGSQPATYVSQSVADPSYCIARSTYQLKSPPPARCDAFWEAAMESPEPLPEPVPAPSPAPPA